MDTGNNGQMLQMNVEAIAEVKVLTAELPGGVRPLERTADHGRDQERHQPVPRLGVRRQAQLRLEREQLGQQAERRSRRRSSKRDDWGYSIGGPVGKPGGTNKLFFFYSQEYRPRNAAARRSTASACRRRSSGRATSRRSRDNNGALFPYIRDSATGLPCSAGQHPRLLPGWRRGRAASRRTRLYPTGLNILNLWPLPNVTQASGADTTTIEVDRRR